MVWAGVRADGGRGRGGCGRGGCIGGMCAVATACVCGGGGGVAWWCVRCGGCASREVWAILCVVVLAVGPHVVLASNWWELLLVFVWILLLTSGLSLALAAINVKHRDVAFVVGAIIPLWFYATPIVYELKMLPARFGSYLYLNPLTGIVEVFRHAVMGIDPLNWNMCWWSSLESVVVFVLGGIIFFRLSPWFDDWV